MNHRRVGLISTMAPGETWAQSVVDRVSETHGRVKKIIEDMGFEVYDDGPIHRTYEQLTQAGKNLRYRGINALVIYVGTWTYANCSVSAALEAGVPIIIWGDAEPGTCGLVGSSIARGGMSEYGIHANLVYGPFDDEKVRARCKLLLNATCAAMALRGQKMGLGGGTCMGMVTAVCDPNEVKQKFGVEIDTFEQMVIIQKAEEIDDKVAYTFLDWIKATFGRVIAKESAMVRQIKLYMALNQFCIDNRYDFVAVKCLPEMANYYTSFCLCHSIMGDQCDADGCKDRFIFSCEADINAALTMQIMKLLQDGPVMFTDLTQYDFAENVLTTCNCGSQPTDFAEDKREVIWEVDGVHEHYWKYGGACPQHIAKAGRVTMARLARNNGKYEMLIVPAEAVKFPREKLKETVWERPHAYFKLLCNRELFFDSVRSNHIHVVYGDCADELVEVCKILDVMPVVLS